MDQNFQFHAQILIKIQKLEHQKSPNIKNQFPTVKNYQKIQANIGNLDQSFKKMDQNAQFYAPTFFKTPKLNHQNPQNIEAVQNHQKPGQKSGIWGIKTIKNGPKLPISWSNSPQNPKIGPPKTPKYSNSPKSPKTKQKSGIWGPKLPVSWSNPLQNPKIGTPKTPQILKQSKITKNRGVNVWKLGRQN